MFDKIIKGVSTLLLSSALYIVNDFNKDLQEKFDSFDKNISTLASTVSSMSDSMNMLNTTMASVVAKDEAKNIQLQSHTKRFERLEREYDNRIQRLEESYFSKNKK